MTPPPGVHVINEIVVPAVPFAWSVLLIGLALFFILCVALSDRGR
jgi:hypothetical protein